MFWILGAAALGAAGFLMWLLSRKKKKQPEEPPEPMPAEPADSGVPEAIPPPREIKHERNDAAIDSIANHIEFATAPIVLKSVKVGEKLEPTRVPTEDIMIRPMRNVAELTRALPETAALDDDVYYGQVAANKVPVTEYLERVDITEDRVGQPHNVITVLLDVSPSMNDDDRIGWAMRLCRKVIERADKNDAEVALMPFSGWPHGWHQARTAEERKELIKQLGPILAIGSGTDIQAVLDAGIQLLSDPSYTARKMLLITDGTQGVDEDAMRTALKALKVDLHTVCIGVDNDSLRKISKKFDLFN